MHWSRSSWIRSAVLAHSTVSVVNDHRCSLSAVWDDSIGTGNHASRSFVIVAVSAFRGCCLPVRSDHSRSLGDSENSCSFCRSDTRCGRCRGNRRLVDLEHCVQPDICLISVSGGKRQTPRRTGAFVKRRIAYQAATAPCASHSSLAAF